MKMNYEAPNAEVINFTSLEQLASVTLGDLNGAIDTPSRDF